MQRVYASAVWIEKKKERVGVIPACWIENRMVHYPSTPNRPIRTMIRECECEGREDWLKFSLVTVKHISGMYYDGLIAKSEYTDLLASSIWSGLYNRQQRARVEEEKGV